MAATMVSYEAPTQEAAKSWVERQKEMKGLKAPGSAEAPKEPEAGESYLEAAAEAFGSDTTFCVDGRKFRVIEPTWGQIKRHLFPAVSKMKNDLRGTSDDIVALLRGTEEFQNLMLASVIFEDGHEPSDRSKWADDLTATKALELANAFKGGIDFPALLKQAKLLLGKA